jgi:hypothetical protein
MLVGLIADYNCVVSSKTKSILDYLDASRLTRFHDGGSGGNGEEDDA